MVKTRSAKAGAIDSSRDTSGSELDFDGMVSKINQDIHDTGTMNGNQATLATYQHLFYPSSPFNLRAMMSKITALEEKVEQNELKIAELKVKIQELENCGKKNKDDIKDQVNSLSIESCKTQITLANIPLSLSNPSDTTENVDETSKVVDEILSLTGQSVNSVKEFKRLHPKDTQNPDITSPNHKTKQKDPKIFIDFQNMIELRKFMQKLKEIRAQEKFTNLVIDNVCPGFLLKDYLLANKKGFILRKEKKLITRTWITKDGVVLKSKKPGNGPWEKVKFDQ